MNSQIVLQALSQLGFNDGVGISGLNDINTANEYLARVRADNITLPDWLTTVLPQCQLIVAKNKIPDSVYSWQLKAILQSQNLLTAANNAVINSGNNNIIMAWNYAPRISRNTNAMNNLGASIGLTPTNLDNIFIAADAITI